MKTIKLYTDGACSGNGKKNAVAGWGWVLIDDCEELAFGKGYIEEEGTNNKGELDGIIFGLAHIMDNYKDYSKLDVQVFTDSIYCLNGITNWIHNWKRNGWKTANGGNVKNVNRWKELDKLVSNMNVTFNKVAGHTGDKYNEKADDLAVSAVEDGKIARGERIG